MKLSQLLSKVKYTAEFGDAEIAEITCDSRRACAGTAFVAVKGDKFDGHDYAAKAAEQGAEVIICERDLGLERQVIVENSRSAYAFMCAEINGNPSQKLKLIGVTGTNGKTTITYLIKQILESAGKKVGLIGTIQNEINDMAITAKHTTPDPAELHTLFSRMVSAGCEYVVMETSSHAFAQHRLDGCTFDVGVFTNLTQDHLDYHKTMENYFEAKKQLFKMSKLAVINYDDECGRKLIDEIECSKVSFSVCDDNADFTAKSVEKRPSGVSFAFVGKGVIERVNFCMPGSFSVSNAMAAAACCVQLGISPADTARGLNCCKGVKGRTEVLYSGDDFTVICDYAHSPDGLEKVVSAIKEVSPARVVVLFGCAGNRDRTKRPKMTNAVGRFADFAVLTSDNPRDEDPIQIINDAIPGFEGTGVEYKVIPDRLEAIKWVLANARQDDVIILAGKGHEDYQVLSFGTVAFDEHKIVEKLLSERDN